MTTTEARERLYEAAETLTGFPLRTSDMTTRLERISRRLTARADEGADCVLTWQGLEPIMARLEAVVDELESAA